MDIQSKMDFCNKESLVERLGLNKKFITLQSGLSIIKYANNLSTQLFDREM